MFAWSYSEIVLKLSTNEVLLYEKFENLLIMVSSLCVTHTHTHTHTLSLSVIFGNKIINNRIVRRKDPIFEGSCSTMKARVQL